MFGIGTTELILILVIAFVVFGAGKLPELGTGLGKAIRNFKSSSNGNELDSASKAADGADKHAK